MRSKVAWGKVGHFRAAPARHGFSYPIFTFELDVDELERLRVGRWLFRSDRWALLMLRSSDYLSGEGTLRQKVEAVLQSQGISTSPSRITLMTMPRFCGYIFNPVSFFACFDAQNRVLGLVTQVSNTFGETHVYPLVCAPQAMPVTWRFSKEFFVSPFFNREGTYRVVLESEGDQLSVVVDLEKDGQTVFSSYLRGEAQTLTTMRVLGTVLRFPFTSFLTMIRIHFQALVLYFKRRLTPVERPEPNSPNTIRSQQDSIHKVRLWLLSLLRGARG
jgi:DUF1365 family protein